MNEGHDPASSGRTGGGLSRNRFLITAFALAFIAAISEMQQLMVIPMLGLLSGSLDISASATSWVLLATLVVGAVSIGPLSRLADRFGPKSIYLWSMTAILLGNALCALAIMFASPPLMILGRALIGVNIATALGVAVLKRLCTDRQMKQGMGIVTLGLGIGVAPAFLISGALINLGVSLQGVFWVSTAMTLPIIGLILLLPRTQGTLGISIPLRSSALLGIWVVPACLALSFGNEWHWVSIKTLGLLALSVALFLTWIRNESAARNPLVAPYMLRGDAAIGYYATACVGLLAYGYYITASAFVQVPSSAGYGFGSSIFEAGLVLLPVAIVIPALGPLSGRLIYLWGAKNVLILGALVLTAQFITMAFVKSELWQMYVYAAWFGIGIALFMPAGWAIFAVQAEPSEIGIAGGMAQIFQTLFGSLGASIGVVFVTRELIPGTPYSVVSGFSGMFAFLAAALAAAAILGTRLKHSGPISV